MYNAPKSNDPGVNPQQAEQSLEVQLFDEILKRLDSKSGNRDARHTAAVHTIDPVELFYFLLSKIHYIALSAVIGAMLLGIFGSVRVAPIYNATAKLYIMGETNISIISDLQVGATLASDYRQVFDTWEVHQMVNEQLGTDYTYSQLQKMLTVENPSGTRILNITVKNADPEMAASIANAYAMSAKKFITQTMTLDEPRTFSVALVPSINEARSVTTWIIYGILLGTILAGGIFVLMFLLDNRPKSPESILKAAGLPTLAVVPIDTNKKRRSGGKKR